MCRHVQTVLATGHKLSYCLLVVLVQDANRRDGPGGLPLENYLCFTSQERHLRGSRAGAMPKGVLRKLGRKGGVRWGSDCWQPVPRVDSWRGASVSVGLGGRALIFISRPPSCLPESFTSR